MTFMPGCFRGKANEQFKAKTTCYPEEFRSIDLENPQSKALIKKYGYAVIELDCGRNLQ
jgi:hypothetical protein